MKIKDLDQVKEVIDFLEAFVLNLHGFLLLAGKNGTGKSFTAMAVYNNITPYKLPAYDHDIAIFITQSELNLRWINEQAKWNSVINLLDQMCKTKLLIIDDLGTRTPTEAFMDFLYIIVDKRYSQRYEKATIITTNLNVQTMREKFSDAFVSRVASGTCFKFEGKDRRFKENAF